MYRYNNTTKTKWMSANDVINQHRKLSIQNAIDNNESRV